MTRLWRLLGAFVLFALSGTAQAAGTLLWLTSDITPALRTALVARAAESAGLTLRQLEYPLQGPPALDATQRTQLDQALREARWVWIDAPHPTALARLRGLLGERLAAHRPPPGQRPMVWVAEGVPQGADEARIAAYLQAGGEANVRHAVQLAQAQALASERGQPLPTLPPPTPFPTRGVYHPDAPALFADAQAFAVWQQAQPALRGRPAVAVLVHRYHFVNGGLDWLDAWLRLFEAQGLAAYAVFAQQVDPAGLAALLEVPVEGGRTAHPRVIVSHQLLPQGAALAPLFTRWGVPLLATLPYRQGDAAAWRADTAGLSSGDVPFYLAQPEAAGAIDPLLVSAAAEQGRRTELVVPQAQAVVAKARRLIALQDKPSGTKHLALMVYHYPPGGSHFGASFLNVPRSLEQVSKGLADAGYATHGVNEAQWIEALTPLLAAYYDGADLTALLAHDQAAALPLREYQRWWAAQPAALRQRVEAQWGPPARSRYVVRWQGEPVFVIPRVQVGALCVLPQPPREETLHRGQDPFMHRSATPLSHHYLATYLWARQADALIHFGTHGTQEWAPGKSRALDVDDEALLPLGDVPVVYPYIVDNLGEALTAKRRGRAVMVSHRTPQFAPAGFEARMARMHELMHEWETVDAGPTRQALERELVARFEEHHLDRDLGWTPAQIAADFAGFLERLHPYLDRLAQSAQPQGLAVFGRVPDAAVRRLSILQALRQPLIEALGEDIDEAFLIDYQKVAGARPARWLDVALRDADAASELDLRSEPASNGPVPNRAALKPIDRAALRQLAERAQALEALLASEGEMPGLLAALQGRYLPAAYGGDFLRNPESLPTGRNLVGLDPSRLPTRQAYEVAQRLFADWLQAWRAGHGGRWPSRLALSLWAGETLRQQGVMEAQALVALGVAPVWDDSGRPNRLRLVPPAELGRPRVDVLLSITGSYRDQFPALMALVDQAVALAASAASAEPGNAVAANTRAVAQALSQRGVAAALAEQLARARVFGNGVGDYGTGLSDAVQADGLKRNARDTQNGGSDPRLGELFLARMSQPYVAGQALPGVPAATAAQALGAHLRQADAALMSRSSHLYAMASSDDPFQYLGGLAAAARAAGKAEPLGLYVNQVQDSGAPHTESAAQALALELQSRYLHPGWLQAQQAEGYTGTLQVLKALQYTWGWQATAPDTVRPDHWQSFFDVLVKDKHQQGVPQWLARHPQAYAQALERLVQAARQGWWQPDGATRDALAQRYAALTRQAPLPTELAGVRRWVAQALSQSSQAQAMTPLARPVPRHRPVAAPAGAAVVPMQGVLLHRQPDAPPPDDRLRARLAAWLSEALALCSMALLVAAGAVWQHRRAGRLSRAVAVPRRR